MIVSPPQAGIPARGSGQRDRPIVPRRAANGRTVAERLVTGLPGSSSGGGFRTGPMLEARCSRKGAIAKSGGEDRNRRSGMATGEGLRIGAL